MRRIAPGALCLASVPILAWISLVDALAESVTRVPYWLAALLPLCVGGVYLWRSR